MIDFNLNNDFPIQTDNIDLVLQQISLLFDTRPKEVFGDEYFGTTYEKYLYDLKLSNYELERVISEDLDTLDLCGFSPTVKVHLLQGTEKDIALVDIVLTRGDENYQQIYKID